MKSTTITIINILLILLITGFGVSCCDSKLDNENKKTDKGERECKAFLFEDSAHSNQESESKDTCVRFNIIAYDYFEIHRYQPDLESFSISRIDIAGETIDSIIYQAIIKFIPESDSLKSPILITNDRSVLIKMEYPQSKLPNIKAILESGEAVSVIYKSFVDKKKWAALVYHKTIPEIY